MLLLCVCDGAAVLGWVYLQVVGGFEPDPRHQAGVSPQVVDTLLGGGAEHLHTLSRGAQEEAAATSTHSLHEELSLYQLNLIFSYNVQGH